MDFFSHEKGPDYQRVAAGFSRLDLLAVLAVAGVMFLLTAAGVANDGASSDTITCMQNQKQLIRAWQLYAEDNDGRLALNAGISSTATTTNWAYNSINFNFNEYNWKTNYVLDAKFASLGPYVKEAKFFRCPSDKSKFNVQGTTLPRVRSFSMNYYIGKVTDNNFFLGGMRFYARLSDLVKPQPTQHFVFMDSHPDSLFKSDFHIDAAVRGRGQWFEYPAAFHQSGASIGYADGRVEVRIWSESSTKPPVRYNGLLFGGGFALSRDYDWIAARASGEVN